MPPDPYAPLPPSGYQPPPGPAGADDTLAWAGAAASAASWLTCCCTPIPFVGMVLSLLGLALAVVGVVCGALAYRAAGRVGGRTDLPILAIALGAARLVITLGILGLVLVLGVGIGFSEFFRHLGH